MPTKATLYFDPKVFRALKVKAALSDQSISETANALIEQGLALGAKPGKPAAKVELSSEGRLGFPVLSLDAWPEGFIFDRENLYD